MTSFRTNSICIDLSPTSARKKCNGDAINDNDTHEQQQRHNTTITIQCLSKLTPLDMMDMSFGIADPTGSCVWLGAFLFMEMFSRDLELETTNTPTSSGEIMQQYWSQVRSTLFPPNCHAIELGAGTGMSGLSLMMMMTSARDNAQTGHTEENIARTTTHYTGPSLLVQTDANDDALELCRINNVKNDGRGDVYVKKLEWGRGNAAKVFGCQEEEDTVDQVPGRTATSPTVALPTTYDVVFATDVLYDLASLVPLVTTASELLKEAGYFILSHVPRASVDGDDENDSISESVDCWQQLESIIVKEASKVQLTLASFPPVDENSSRDVLAPILQSMNDEQNKESDSMILRPSLLPHVWGASSSLSRKYSWKRMMDAGAGIFVFQKKGL